MTMAKPKESPEVAPTEPSEEKVLLLAVLAAHGVGKWYVTKQAHTEAAREGRLKLVIEKDPFTLGTNVQVRHVHE
jgi:hypothetical protein